MKQQAENHIQESDRLNVLVDATSNHLNTICAPHKIQMGLTSDEFRATPAYKMAKREFDTAFSNLRNYNKTISNKVKREAGNIRRERKMNKRIEN